MKLRLIIAVLFCSALSGSAQSLAIATYNLRYDNPRDTGNLWIDRSAAVISLIRFHDFDVFGTQEGLKNQLDDVGRSLPQYNRYGVGRTDGRDGGEFSAIFFKKDRFRLLRSGDFWLSQTPDKPSLGWDARCCNRICSWVYLQDVKSRKKFFVFNVHFDHQGKIARIESAKLMLNKINGIAGKEPVLLTGDFNGAHDSAWYKTLAYSDVLSDTYNHVQYPYVNNGSFQAFGKQVNNNDIIDHIFMSAHFTVHKWGVLTDSYKGKYPSDHFPVVTVLGFK